MTTPNLLFISLMSVMALATAATTTAYAVAPVDKADFYLQAQNANETVDDFTDTMSQCKQLEESYRLQGYTIIQHCFRGPDSG